VTRGVAVVTGGASGIGRALCIALAARGARVVVADVDEDGARRVAREIGATAAVVDVTDPAAVDALVNDTVATHGRLDLMVNCAGTGLVGEAHRCTIEQWRRFIDVNLMGVVHGTWSAYRAMVAQGDGHIVNVSSGAGLLPTTPAAAYGAAKAGVVGLSASLREEAHARGVRVSVVCPGGVDTPVFRTGTVVGLPREQYFALFPAKLIPPERAAAEILRGIERDDAYIVFPGYLKAMWRVQRFAPGLFARLTRRSVAGWRRLAVEEERR
jgi:NAD(P)-dependent dehydrogenase (short-subunit alcohol dehydrogenase family)